MFYLNSNLNFGIPPVLVFQLEVYYKLDRLLTGLTAQQKGATARWYSNKTSLVNQNKCFFRVLYYYKTDVNRKLINLFTIMWHRVHAYRVSRGIYKFWQTWIFIIKMVKSIVKLSGQTLSPFYPYFWNKTCIIIIILLGCLLYYLKFSTPESIFLMTF